MPQGANTNTHKPNGTQPNQNFEKNFTKSRTLTHFRKKIPNFRTLRKFLHNLSGKDEKNVKNIPLRLILQRFA